MEENTIRLIFYVNSILFMALTYFGFTRIFERNVKVIWVLLAYAAYIVIGIEMFFEFGNMWVNVGISTTAFLLLALLFSGNLHARLVFAFLMYVMSATAEILAFALLNLTYYLEYGIMMPMEYIQTVGRTLANVIFVPLLLITIVIFRKIFSKKDKRRYLKIPARYTVSILLVLAGIVLLNVFFISTAIDEIQAKAIPIILSHIASTTIVFIIIWLYKAVPDYLYAVEQNKRQELRIEHQEVHMDSQKTIGKIVHNIKVDFLKLSNLLNAGQIEEAKQHLEGKIGKITNDIETENLAVDTTINYYKRIVEEKLGIKLITNLMIPKNINVDPDTIMVVLGNALQNAVEASEYVEQSRRKIYVGARITEDNLLIIEITNTYAVEPIPDKQGALITTKKSKHHHGIGLDSIEEVLADGIGLMDVEYSDNTFQFTVIFYNAVDRKDA